MKNIVSLAIIGLLINVGIYAQEKKGATVKLQEAFVGEWTIDLRPTPDSEGYFQPFVVNAIEENSFTGTFYGSNLENVILNKNWEKIYFAFITKDKSNAYYHSGYLFDGKLYGITYCPNRDFAVPWTGLKK